MSLTSLMWRSKPRVQSARLRSASNQARRGVMNSTSQIERQTASRREKPFGPRWLRISFWLCTVIAVAAVIRRLFALADPPQSGPPQLVTLDAEFASTAALTLAHIVPALAFVLLAPLVFMRRFADARWIDPVLYSLGAIVGATAYAMSGHPVGGWVAALGGVAVQHAVLVFAGTLVPVLATRRGVAQA